MAGIAHDNLLSVRLLHAALRILIPKAIPPPPTPSLPGSASLEPCVHRQTGLYNPSVIEGNHPQEIPINQHDLAITNALFGYMNLRSLWRLGIRLPALDAEAYSHMWRYAGWLLGIEDSSGHAALRSPDAPASLPRQESLLPTSVAAERDFFHASLLHQCHPERHPTPRQRPRTARPDPVRVLPGQDGPGGGGAVPVRGSGLARHARLALRRRVHHLPPADDEVTT